MDVMYDICGKGKKVVQMLMTIVGATTGFRDVEGLAG